MKMNTKTFGILALLTVLVIGVVLISGCVGPVEDAPVEEEEVAIQTEGPPTSDVAGEDISDVPRYPGSVRTAYLGDGTMLWYVTSASVDEVLAFYEKELPANGWTVLGRMQVDYAILIGADKGNRRLMVECSRSEDHAEGWGYIYYGPNYTTHLIMEY